MNVNARLRWCRWSKENVLNVKLIDKSNYYYKWINKWMSEWVWDSDRRIEFFFSYTSSYEIYFMHKMWQKITKKCLEKHIPSTLDVCVYVCVGLLVLQFVWFFVSEIERTSPKNLLFRFRCIRCLNLIIRVWLSDFYVFATACLTMQMTANDWVLFRFLWWHFVSACTYPMLSVQHQHDSCNSIEKKKQFQLFFTTHQNIFRFFPSFFFLFLFLFQLQFARTQYFARINYRRPFQMLF